MRERTIWIISIVVIVLVGIAGAAYTVVRNQSRPPSGENSSQNAAASSFSSLTAAQVPEQFQQPTPQPLNAETPVAQFKRTGWIPDWDWAKGYDSVKSNPKAFHSISPVWYYVDKDGNTKANRTGYNELKNLAKANNIKLIPSIANFDSREFHKILGDEAKLTAHIAYLKNEVSQYGYDGLDLDYESIQLDDQQAFLRLVRELYEFLDPQGKILSIAIMTTYTDADVLRSGRQTRHTQAWQEVGTYVHEFRLMTYDMTGHRSQYPGPISPVDWLEAVLRYTVPRVDNDKIMLGLNLYSYGGWGNNLEVPQPYLSFLSNPWLEESQASALLYRDVIARKSTAISNIFDPATKEKILRYRREGREFISFYIDAEVAKYRIDLAKLYNVGGVAYWRLGGEDLNIFKL